MKNHILHFIFRIIISGIAVLGSSLLLPGVETDSFLTALLVALMLAFLNTFIKPVLIFLTIPITVFSFGLFLLVINAIIILMAGKLIPGFTVNGFWWALIFSIILSVITSLLNYPLKRRHQ